MSDCPVDCQGCTAACPRLITVHLRGGPWDGLTAQVTHAQHRVLVPHDREGRLRGCGTGYLPTSQKVSGMPVWEVEPEKEV